MNEIYEILFVHHIGELSLKMNLVLTSIFQSFDSYSIAPETALLMHTSSSRQLPLLLFVID